MLGFKSVYLSRIQGLRTLAIAFLVLNCVYTHCAQELSGQMVGVASSVGENETMELDFVNLPGYGVIDDANTTLNDSFSCYEKRYGYYADIIKNCSVFHLCYPTRESSEKEIIYQRFSFVCSDNFVFDQRQLVCVDNSTTPVYCEKSIDFYISSNDRLIESLQQSQPDMFVEDSDFASVNSTDTGSISTDDTSGTAIGRGKNGATSNVHNEYR